VKLLSSLKQEGPSSAVKATNGGRHPHSASPGTSLIGTVSKIIHELTKDTRRLADIKQRLEPIEDQSWPVSAKNAYHLRQTSSHRGYPPRTESSLSYDMPLQRARHDYNRTQELGSHINFVNDEGASRSMSRTYSRRAPVEKELIAYTHAKPTGPSQKELERLLVLQGQQ
jgi:hypothetical protein